MIDTQDLREEWINHPHTHKVKKAFERLRDEAMRSLMQVALRSTDPTVRDVASRLGTLEATIKFMAKEGVNG